MIFLLARAIHREHILVTVFLKKEIATAKELDLRPLGKVIIFCDKQTNRQNLPIIYRFNTKTCFLVLLGK